MQTELSNHRVGSRLKHARLARGLRLKDVAELVGCTEGLISKIENGRANPSLNMLHQIVGAIGTNIAAVFAETDGGNVVQRQGERPILTKDQLRKGDGIALERLVPASPGHLLQGNLHVIEPLGQSEGSISHLGEEVGYVVEGELELTVDGRTWRLATGDSFFFDSSLPHSYRNPGTVLAKVVWINTPATY